MSNINILVLESIDIPSTFIGSLAATAGSSVGTNLALAKTKEKDKEKVLKHPIRYADYAPIMAGAFIGKNVASPDYKLPGIALGAGLGGLVGGHIATKLAKHFVEKEKLKRKNNEH